MSYATSPMIYATPPMNYFTSPMSYATLPMSYATPPMNFFPDPQWVTSHPQWAPPHLTMSYATPHNDLRYTPNELLHTLNELRHNPQWEITCVLYFTTLCEHNFPVFKYGDPNLERTAWRTTFHSPRRTERSSCRPFGPSTRRPGSPQPMASSTV
jgi:hypothetical protein